MCIRDSSSTVINCAFELVLTPSNLYLLLSISLKHIVCWNIEHHAFHTVKIYKLSALYLVTAVWWNDLCLIYCFREFVEHNTYTKLYSSFNSSTSDYHISCIYTFLVTLVTPLTYIQAQFTTNTTNALTLSHSVVCFLY